MCWTICSLRDVSLYHLSQGIYGTHVDNMGVIAWFIALIRPRKKTKTKSDMTTSYNSITPLSSWSNSYGSHNQNETTHTIDCGLQSFFQTLPFHETVHSIVQGTILPVDSCSISNFMKNKKNRVNATIMGRLVLQDMNFSMKLVL